MSPTPLPLAVRTLVRLTARLVPRRVRAEWVEEWSGELHYLRHVAGVSTGANLTTLRRSLGCVTDAVCIRAHEWSPDMLLQDLRFALRTHLKQPGFAVAAILTLALGIGANTALFSVVNALLLKPLPYRAANELVRLYGTNSARGLTRSNMNPNDLLDLAARSETLVGVSYYGGFAGTLRVDGGPIRVLGGMVHSSFFEVLGVQPALGRFFAEEENIEGNDTVVVLSYATWQRFFGGDRSIIGRRLEFDEPHTVIGVAPADFSDPFQARDMWSPWAQDPENRGGHFMRAVARMRPGVTLERAQEEINAIYTGIAEEQDKPTRGITAVQLQKSIVGETRPLLMLLFGAVGFLLLIICANIANLMLTRALNRRQEIAVRMALGAGRGRLVRQFVSESLLLALAAGALGLVLARVLGQSVAVAAAADLPKVFDVALDSRVLGFCLLATLGAGVLFGLAPALHGTRASLAESLRERRSDHGSKHRGHLRGGLVVVQVALSLMLLIGAGLMLRSLGNLMSVDPVFDSRGVLTFRMSLPGGDYPEAEQVPAFYEQLIQRLGRLPGVQAVGATNRLPFSGSYSCDFFMLEGWPVPEAGSGNCAEERVIAGDYFDAMGIEVVKGRGLNLMDNADGQPVVLVSQTMADRYMSGEEPLGRGFNWGLSSHDTVYRRVVGVVEDIKHLDLAGDAMTEVYMPHQQYPYYRTMFVVVRADDPMALLPAVRAAMREQDPSIPIYAVAALEDLVDGSLSNTRTGAQVLGSFATLALVLACVGLYGVLAYMVSQRTHEFGVRMALGARGHDVVSMVLRQAMTLVSVGVALGLVGAWGLSGALSSALFQVQSHDPITYAAIALVLFAVAGVAAYLPAHRATRVDPVRALRED